VKIKRPHQIQVGFRLPATVVSAIDAYAIHLQNTLLVPATRTDAACRLLLLGLKTEGLLEGLLGGEDKP
jgi:hypothetical protein